MFQHPHGNDKYHLTFDYCTLSKSELTIVEKQLKYVKNNKKGKECIEMNIKCISPFHILVMTRWFDEVFIAHKPAIQDMLMKSKESGSEKFKSQHLSTDSSTVLE
jgi:hypothetical protein